MPKSYGAATTSEPWEYLHLLDHVTAQSLPIAELNEIVGYQPRARVQGFNVLD